MNPSWGPRAPVHAHLFTRLPHSSCTICTSALMTYTQTCSAPSTRRRAAQLRQTFERFDAPSPAAAADARLAHFKAHVWPRLQESCTRGGVLLFVPQYFDFVRLRWGQAAGPVHSFRFAPTTPAVKSTVGGWWYLPAAAFA